MPNFRCSYPALAENRWAIEGGNGSVGDVLVVSAGEQQVVSGKVEFKVISHRRSRATARRTLADGFAAIVRGIRIARLAVVHLAHIVMHIHHRVIYMRHRMIHLAHVVVHAVGHVIGRNIHQSAWHSHSRQRLA